MHRSWVVVGAGVAGSVVAARLLEAGASAVSLLDLGSDHPTTNDLTEAVNVEGRTIDDLFVRRVKGGPRVRYTSGSGLGGGSAINGLVLATTGPFAHDLRIPVERSYGVRRQTRNGQRVTTAEAYLGSTDVARLTVDLGVAISRIDFDGGVASAVSSIDGRSWEADAVVVCAGALASGPLLMRSGVVVDGLGEGLQDHPSITCRFQRLDSDPDGIHDLNRDRDVQSIAMTIANEYVVVPALMRPYSAGHVALDADGRADVQFLIGKDERDLQRLVAAVRSVGASHPNRSSLDGFSEGSTDDLEQWVHSQIATSTPVYSHASSGCAMGRVVDRLGRVHRYSNLFVADASVFPRIPSVNPMVPVMQLAETLVDRWIDAGLVGAMT